MRKDRVNFDKIKNMITPKGFDNGDGTFTKVTDRVTPKIETVDPLPTSVQVPAESFITLDFDSLKENSLVVIKIKQEDDARRAAASMQIVKALQPFREIFKNKKITLLIMSTEETIAGIDETEMEEAGWVRKQKSSIILPTDKNFKGIR